MVLLKKGKKSKTLVYLLLQVMDRMEDLKRQYDEKSKQKEELRKQAELTELKLDRAGKLVSGLAGERERWEASVQVPYNMYYMYLCAAFCKEF